MPARRAGWLRSAAALAAAGSLTLPVAAQSPYGPLGVRLGLVEIYPTAGVVARYTDNVFANRTDKESDLVTEFVAGFTANTLWARDTLNADLEVRARRYRENENQDRTSIIAGLSGQFDATEDDTVGFDLRFRRQAEIRNFQDVDPNLPPAENIRFDSYSASLLYERRVNNFALSVTGFGGTVDYPGLLNDRDRDDAQASLRVSYALSPSLSAYLQPAFAWQDFPNFDSATSTTLTALAGARFDLSTIWVGDIGVGVFKQDYRSDQFKDLTSFAVNGRLTWKPSALTTVTASTVRSQAPNTRPGAGNLVSTRFQLSVRHDFLLNLSAEARVNYAIDDFGRVDDGSDRRWEAELRGEYQLNRNLGLTASVQHRRRESDSPGREYKQNNILLGIRVRL
ncbi:outer membrane beta-barrel protein [Aerophototrophica crusticola]|uniref:Outer membrane beta-barrel protein n=1 Tax=Aerophototrophica crusticola TaxID=1709002 RepID=A0A858R4B1_9PROT|nr:outer membrane beta-barrel protein [Rhodospirillaceae bacterium B3]